METENASDVAFMMPGVFVLPEVDGALSFRPLFCVGILSAFSKNTNVFETDKELSRSMWQFLKYHKGVHENETYKIDLQLHHIIYQKFPVCLEDI